MTNFPHLSDPFSPSIAVVLPAPAPVPASNQASASARQSFELLRDIVREMEESGKKTFVQGIKPEMQRRTGTRSPEGALGFKSFASFVEAAAEAGYITLGESGMYLVLHSIGFLSAETDNRLVIRPRHNGVGAAWQPAIRPDLWRAFTDWQPTRGRVWDRQEKAAFMYPLEPYDADAQGRQLLQLVRAQPDRFVEIPRTSLETQLDWMREFSQSLSEERHGRLLISLLSDDSGPAGDAFMRYVRGNPQVRSEWGRFKVARVRPLVEAWIRRAHLGSDILKAAPAPAQNGEVRALTHRPAGQAHVTATAEEEHTRERVMNAVRRMPLADLLRLSIPVEYMIDPR